MSLLQGACDLEEVKNVG